MKSFFTFLLVFCLPFFLAAQIWTAQNPNYPQPLLGFDVEAVSASTAWTVGITGDYAVLPWNIGADGHYFSHTADGGFSWTSGTFPSTGAGYTSNISAIDANVAWIAYVDYGDGNHIFKTIDGGNNWADQNTVINVWIDVVHFWDNATGFAMGDPDSLGFQIATTSNGGVFWERVSPALIPSPLPGEFGITNLYCVAGNKVWFATNYGRVYYSANKGYTWQVSDPGVNAFPDKLACNENGHCLLTIGDNSDTITHNNKYHLWHTGDAGATWTEITSADDAWAVTAIQYVPGGNNRVVATFRHNNATGPFETRISDDNGTNWQTIDNGTKLFDLDFASANIGWATEYKNTDAVPTKIYKYAGNPLLGLFSPNTLEADVSISPNPAADFVQVDVNSKKSAAFWLLLHDAQGRLLRKMEIPPAANFSETIELNDLPGGVYLLTISSEDGSTVRQVVKK